MAQARSSNNDGRLVITERLNAKKRYQKISPRGPSNVNDRSAVIVRNANVASSSNMLMVATPIRIKMP
jgi:hypothetical protein